MARNTQTEMKCEALLHRLNIFHCQLTHEDAINIATKGNSAYRHFTSKIWKPNNHCELCRSVSSSPVQKAKIWNLDSKAIVGKTWRECYTHGCPIRVKKHSANPRTKATSNPRHSSTSLADGVVSAVLWYPDMLSSFARVIDDPLLLAQS